jgi:DNA polymerase III alpha subunit
MKIDNYGQVVLTTDDLIQGLYSGKITNLTDITLNDQEEITRFQNAVKRNYNKFQSISQYQIPEISVEQFDTNLQDEWFMSEGYRSTSFDIVDYVFSLCKTDDENKRVEEELTLFAQYNLIELLCYLKYLVDTMRSNNIVWGVGRGSSVASYVLYLLGVHKVDSIKYGLDIREFLK